MRSRIAELKQTNRKLKRAENLLQESAENYRSLVANIPDVVWTSDYKGNTSFISPNVQKVYGYSPEEIYKEGDRLWFGRIHPDDIARVKQAFKMLFEKGTPFEIDYRIKRKDGQWIWLHDRSIITYEKDGVMYADGVFFDITKRKIVEAGLKQYQLMVESAQDAILFKDLKSRYIAVNKKALEGFGLTREQVIGKNDYELMPNRDEAGKNIEGDFIVFRTGKPLEAVRQITLADGKKHWFHTLKVPHFDAEGKIVGLVGIGRDITEHKKAEEEVKTIKQQMEFILGTTKTGMDIIDSQFNIRFIDTEWQKIYGDPKGKKCYEYFMDRKQVCPDCGVIKALQTKKVVITEEMLVKENNRPIQVTTIPFQNEKGEWLVAEVNVDISEQKKAEEALRATLDATTESVFLIDKQLTVLTLNKTAAQRFGRTPQQLVGLHIQDFLSDSALPDVVKYRAEQINKVIRSGKPVRFEDERAGRFFDISIYPVFDAKGKASSAAIFAKDVTEEKKSKASLAESRLRYQTLFDNAPVGIGVSNKEGRVLECNETMLKMMGYSYAESKQINLKDTYVNPQQRQELLKRLQRDGFVRDFEVQLKRKDGTVYDASLTLIPFILSGEEVFLAVKRDITRQKIADEALRHSESKYRTLLENLPQKIFLKNKNSVYISCSENYARDLKIKSEEIAGKTDYDFYPRKLAEKYRADDKKIIESGKTKDIEERYIQDGGEVIVHTVKTPVKDAEGNTTGVLGVFWDITESKRQEAELNTYRERMARVEQLASLGTLSATLAHELTQPLTVISLSIENALAESKAAPCDQAIIEQLKDGLDGIANATSIVERFRNFARKSSERTVNKVDLKAVAERTVKLLNERARRAMVSLHIRGMSKLPPIYSNEKDIEQLFFALIDNAIQVSDGKKERQLVISGTIKDDQIKLRFSDNCGGIAPENIDKIFEPFFTTKSPGEGTGLGLCVVQRIVSQVGGKVWVKSKSGKGSTFFVSLPVGKGGKS